MTDTRHACHADGCDTSIPPRLAFCPRHWRALPSRLKAPILRHYRPGQEVDKQPSREHVEAMIAARDWLRERRP